MNSKPLALLLVLGTALICFTAGRWSAPPQTAPPSATAKGRRVLYYHDPMHPAYKSDKPGIAPDCGMQLEPVYADTAPPRETPSMPPGTVRVSADKQQLIGLRIEEVKRTEIGHRARILGR